MSSVHVYIGTYTGGESRGIDLLNELSSIVLALRFDAARGALEGFPSRFRSRSACSSRHVHGLLRAAVRA